MKKLINDPHSVVREMLEGQVDMHAGQALLEDEDVVVRADLPPFPARREVAVLSGGGGGHEPAHAGYVGATPAAQAVRRAALAAAAALEAAEAQLTELDSAAGDGDLGISMARGAAGDPGPA